VPARGRHGRVREAATAGDSMRALDCATRPVPIFEVQCAEALTDPDVDEFAKDKVFASLARPVPMEALQWDELERPVAAGAGAVELLFEVRPAPIAALQ
jgi:hypothetical protein